MCIKLVKNSDHAIPVLKTLYQAIRIMYDKVDFVRLSLEVKPNTKQTSEVHSVKYTLTCCRNAQPPQMKILKGQYQVIFDR
jgi:hypothetical protein